jgi:hypothetical protein
VLCMGEMSGKKASYWQLFHNFERDLMGKERPDPVKNLKIVEAMYAEARQLGVFPLQNPLEGLETDILIARSVNLVREDPFQDS